MIGFFEEAADVRSMTRLLAFLLAIGCFVLVLLIVAVALLLKANAASVIAAIGVPLVGLAGGIWGALRERE